MKSKKVQNLLKQLNDEDIPILRNILEQYKNYLYDNIVDNNLSLKEWIKQSESNRNE